MASQGATLQNYNNEAWLRCDPLLGHEGEVSPTDRRCADFANSCCLCLPKELVKSIEDLRGSAS